MAVHHHLKKGKFRITVTGGMMTRIRPSYWDERRIKCRFTRLVLAYAGRSVMLNFMGKSRKA